MYKLFESIEIKNIPILDIGDKFGFTGYIDFITNDDMKEPLMRGIDAYGREFLSIQGCFKNKDNKDEYFVSTIFERYNDNKNSLAYGTRYMLNSLFDDSRLRSDADIKFCADRINKLMKGESIYDMENKYVLFVPKIRKQIEEQLESLSKDLRVHTVLPYL